MLNLVKSLISFLPVKVQKAIRLYYAAYQIITQKNSYLVQTGYMESHISKLPIDINGSPLPWMNYPFIDFISKRLRSEMEIFEYGAGYSSLYFANKVGKVVSVEYNRDWYNKIKDYENKFNNIHLHFYPLDDNYPLAITEISIGKKYEIIIIDGRKRVKCAINALPFLKENGVLVLDDSHRTYYQEVFDFYYAKKFKEITFSGLKPSNLETYSTTLFYRSESNCLGI
ncbi:MAG: hypothetical protein OHK0057_21310 [Thermoflexibacter sp.]